VFVHVQTVPVLPVMLASLCYAVLWCMILRWVRPSRDFSIGTTAPTKPGTAQAAKTLHEPETQQAVPQPTPNQQ
jgi:hypothetical protein